MAIDGLISGLDTSSIIEQLMQIERIPQAQLAARQAKVRAAAEAQASIRSKLNDVSTAAAALSSATRWNVRAATSSDDAVATASASSSATTGSLTFTVDQLAARHSLRSGNVITALDTVIASGGNLDLDLGDDVHSIDVGGGTLAEVVAAVNSSGQRVRAAAVNTGDGYRLQLTSTTSGAASTFDVAGLDGSVGGTLVAEAGRDATLTIGSGPGAYSVSSSANTFADILPGVSITAKSVSASPVTIEVTEDVAAITDKVKALVDATNAALLEISTRTAYDSSSNTGASLAGDASARRAAQQLTRSLSDTLGSGFDSVGQVGIRLERTGRFSFDAAAFGTAYAEDPTRVAQLFSQSATVELDGAVTEGTITFSTAGSRSVPGTYEIVVSQEATRAAATGPAASWPTGAPSTIGVRVGSKEVAVELTGTETAEDAAAALQQATDDAGLFLEVTTDGSALSLTSEGWGTAAAFSVAWDGSTWDDHQGLDMAGTIGGEAATGYGRQLTVPTLTPGLGGMSVHVTAAGTGTLGTVTYQAGAAQRVGSALGRALDSIDGYLTSAEKTSADRLKDIQKSIDAFDIRLEKRELRLRTYYSNLEVSLSALQSQSNWLSGQLAGLYANVSS